MLRKSLLSLRTAIGAALAASLPLLVAGCGSVGSASNKSATGAAPTRAISGLLRGGQQPVSGAAIQLYEVGSTGYTSGMAKPLLTSAVTTTSGGTFSIASPYSCDAGSQVYIAGSGGNPGLTGNNPNIALMAALGTCSQLLTNAGSTFISINEVTTVAGAYALAQFSGNSSFGTALSAKPGLSGTSGPADNFTTSTTNVLGITNAMANAQLLANTSTGTSPGVASSTITIPTATVNAIADILSACVNSLGLADPNDTACQTLFNSVNIPAGTNPATGQPYAVPADTLQAVLYMALNPAISSQNSAALFGLISSQSPFATNLTSVPPDWSISLRVAAAGLSAPYGIAIDASGDAWITNEGGSTVTELSPSGSLVNTIGSANILGARGISIDRLGNIWIASTGNDAVVELSSSGTPKSRITSGVTAPLAVANDSSNNTWIASSAANTILEVSSAGTILNTVNGFSAPSSVALDPVGNVWVANAGANNILEVSHSGVLTSTTGDGATQAPAFVAIDANSNVWFSGTIPTTSAIQGSVGQISAGGVAATPIVNTSVLPGGIATSGLSVWMANGAPSGGLLEFELGSGTAVSPVNGFGSLNMPVGVAVDSSGSVWTANSGENTVSIFLGIAPPAITPLSYNVGP